jgi:glycosyltransferase involved in cell wall biosynthesis
VRILFVNENVGGHMTYHANLAVAVQEIPTVRADFLHAPPPGLVRRAIGVEVPALAHRDADFQRLRANLAASAVIRRMVKKALSSERYDAIHVMSQNAALLWPGVLATMPSVVAIDSTTALNAYTGFRPDGTLTPLNVRVEEAFERRVYQAATFVAPVSEWASSGLTRLGVPKERTRVVPFGVPLPPDDPSSAAPRPEIVFVGRYLERKGGRLLLDLHRRFLADRCTLTLVTTEPVEPAPRVQVVSDIRPGDGRIERILRGASAMVFPTAMDQFPNAVLEAMDAGVPVIAFGVGAIPEMVGPDAGVVVAPGDDSALVRAILAVLDDPAAARRMGSAGRQRVRGRFDAQATARERVNLLAEARDRFKVERPHRRRSA